MVQMTDEKSLCFIYKTISWSTILRRGSRLKQLINRTKIARKISREKLSEML